MSEITPDMSEEDIIKKISGTKGLKPETRKTTSDMFSQSRARTESRRLATEKSDKDQKRYDETQGFKERELKLKESKEAREGAKPPPLSQYEKTLETQNAKRFAEINQEMPKIRSAMRVADDVESLIEEMSVFRGWPLNFQEQGELSGKAASMLAPVIKIFNPTGPIPVAKLKYVESEFGIKQGQTRETMRGRFKSLKNFNEEAKMRLEEEQALMQLWNGNPPPEVINKFNAETEDKFDRLIGFDKSGSSEEVPPEMASKLGDPKDLPEGKVRTSKKTGEKFKVEGGRWVRA